MPSLPEIELILSYVSIWSITLPLLVGLILFKNLDRVSRLVFYLVIFAAIPQLLKPCITHLTTLNVLYNLYTLVEFLIIFLIFRNFNDIGRRFLYISFICYCFLALFLVGGPGLKSKFISELVSINNLIYIIWIFSVLFRDFEHNTDTTFIDLKNASFWFLTGLLFYSICTFVIFILWDTIKARPASGLAHLWLIHYIFNINMYVLFSIGFFKNHLSAQKLQPRRL